MKRITAHQSATLFLALLAVVSCVACGALMLDASGARGGPNHYPPLRWAELTPAEVAQGCSLTNWAASFGGAPQPELWTVLDPSGRPTGVNAGGLIEIRCPGATPGSTSSWRACVYGTPPAPVPNPVKRGVYEGDQLVGCKR